MEALRWGGAPVTGYPVVLLSHRKQEFLETALASIRTYATGVSKIIIVDDSGDREHHEWLDSLGICYSLTHPLGKNVGYLMAMNVVWEAARYQADLAGVGHAILWEEDFVLTAPVDFHRLASIMDHPSNARLAQLNLQRQSVYRVERRLGYMESHNRRGYRLDQWATNGIAWVKRKKPFTTNPSMTRREVLAMDWPSREQADQVRGGAEPAMSLMLEQAGWEFGWFGEWNTPATRHVGTAHKTGVGY